MVQSFFLFGCWYRNFGPQFKPNIRVGTPNGGLSRPEEENRSKNLGCLIKICLGTRSAIKSMISGDFWTLSIILSYSASFSPSFYMLEPSKKDKKWPMFVHQKVGTMLTLSKLSNPIPDAITFDAEWTSVRKEKMVCHKSTLMELKWNYACEWWTSKSVGMYSSKKQMKFWLHISQLHNSACIRTSSHIPVYHWEFTWTARKMSTMHLPFPHFVSF